MEIVSPTVRRAGIGLAPLIDVVFILLLFFMLATRFNAGGAIEVGVAGSGASSMNGNSVQVTLAGDSEVIIASGETLDQQQLVEYLFESAEAGTTPAVLLDTDDHLSLQTAISWMDHLKANGIETINLVIH